MRITARKYYTNDSSSLVIKPICEISADRWLSGLYAKPIGREVEAGVYTINDSSDWLEFDTLKEALAWQALTSDS